MKLFYILLLVLSFNVHSQTMISTVTEMSHDDDTTRVYLENGQILKSNKSLLNINIGSTYKFHYGTDRFITLITTIQHLGHLNDLSLSLYNYPDIFQSYYPTIIPSMQRANELFTELEFKNPNSQCFNKAHVWNYSWRIKHQIYSSKAWLFFTRKYIRKHDFQWWFHVAPLLHIKDNDSVVERVTDKKHASKPLSMKEWTNIFMRNNVECPSIDLYSEYANYPETGWCYTMKTNMYYYQPIDIESYERDGKSKNDWNKLEIISAFKDALDANI